MKTFFFEVEVISNDVEKQYRLFTVRATNLDKALELSKFQTKEGESLHQVCIYKKGCKLPKLVWDCNCAL